MSRLCLSSGKYTDDDLSFIMEFFSGMQYNDIYLGNNYISNKGIEKLTLYLLTHTELVNIGLWKNNINTKGITQLLPALHKIRKLFIQNNHILNKGALIFATALKDNTTVEMLSIEDNGLSDGGLIEFCEMIKTNNTLQKLFLNHSALKYQTIEIVSDILAGSYNLDYLEIVKLFDRNTIIPNNLLRENPRNILSERMNTLRANRRNLQMQQLYISLYNCKIVHCEPVIESIKLYLTPKKIKII